MIIQDAGLSGISMFGITLFPTDYEKVKSEVESPISLTREANTFSLFPSREAYDYFWEQADYIRKEGKTWIDVDVDNYLRGIFYSSLLKNVSFRHNDKTVSAFKVLEEFAYKTAKIPSEVVSPEPIMATSPEKTPISPVLIAVGVGIVAIPVILALFKPKGASL